MPDANLTFNTKINEQGFNKGAKNLSSKTLDLKNKIADTTAVIKNLQAELEKTGNTKVKTKAVESLENNIEKTRQKLSEFYAEADTIGNAVQAELNDLGISEDYLDDMLAQNEAWQKVQEKITQTESALNSYERQLKSATDSAPFVKDTAEYQKKQQRLNELTGKLEVYKAKLNETEQAERSNAAQTANAGQKSVDYKNKLKQTIAALKMLSNGVKKVYSGFKKTFSNTIGKSIKSISSRLKSTNSSANVLEKTLRKIKNIITSYLLYKIVHSPFDTIKDDLGEISKISPTVNKNLSDMKSSVNYLKNSLATIAAPLLNLVIPAFVRFSDTIAGVNDKIAQLVAVLSGQSTYTKAVKVQEDYAASLDSTTDSVKNNTEAVEENQKNLAGYDELNVMQQDSNSSSGASSATSSTPTYTNVEVPVSGLGNSLINAIKTQNWNAIGELCGEKINKALSKFNWAKIKTTAKKLGTNIANFLNGGLKTTDWNLVGKTAAEGVNTIISFMLGFSYTFDWALFGRSLRESLVSFFKNLDKDDFIEAFDNIVNGLVTAGIELVGDPNEWQDWGTELEKSIMQAIKGVNWENVKTLFWNLLKGIFNFGDGFFGDLFDDILNALEGKDFEGLGKELSKGVQKIDWEKVFGKDTTIGKLFQVLSKTLIAGLDFVIGFFEDPKTADSLAKGFETLLDNVDWEVIIIDVLTLALFNLPAWITDFATRLVEDFCEGLATGFQYSENDEKLNNAGMRFIKSLGNLIITIIESTANLIINALPNLILGALKLMYDLFSGFMRLFLGNDFYNSATNNLWGPDSFRFDWKINIPRLATGTVVPANYGEFLAVLGDNKREQEFVAPESAMKKAFLEALAESGSSGGNGETVINLNVDGETWFSWLINKNNQYKRTHGVGAF